MFVNCHELMNKINTHFHKHRIIILHLRNQHNKKRMEERRVPTKFCNCLHSLVFHLFPVEIKRKLLSNAFQLVRKFQYVNYVTIIVTYKTKKLKYDGTWSHSVQGKFVHELANSHPQKNNNPIMLACYPHMYNIQNLFLSLKFLLLIRWYTLKYEMLMLWWQAQWNDTFNSNGGQQMMPALLDERHPRQHLHFWTSTSHAYICNTTNLLATLQLTVRDVIIYKYSTKVMNRRPKVVATGNENKSSQVKLKLHNQNP